MSVDIMAAEVPRRSRAVTMETGGLPLVSTFALLTIVAGQLQGPGYGEQEPEFLAPLENITVALGRDVHFTCTVNHLGGYKVAWIKSDTKTILAIHTHMVNINPRLSVTHNGHNTWKLYISSVEPKDSGTYMCQINTDPMKSQMGHLSVVIPPDIADSDGSEASAPEGGSIELRCTANGVPEPTISWKRQGGRNIVFRDENGNEEKVVDSYVGPTLSLKGLRRTDMGNYLCIAANGVPPTQSRKYEVTVLFPPIVRVASLVVWRMADMQVTLQCYVEASPKSLTVWQRGKSHSGAKLLNSSKYVIAEDNLNKYAVRMNITINRLKKNDFGEYTCSAANAYGRANATITLKETPQKTTTTTTTTTSTTTPRPTTTLRTTTRPPKRHLKKQQNQNALDMELNHIGVNNALNFYNINTYGTQNNTPTHTQVHTQNEYSQRVERQKVRPSGPPRHYVVYNRGVQHKHTISLFILVKLIFI
ncbi:lachesin-like isoform X2 [Colias croceus]|uniref:lachesin-like isoform X2 n=1 Tax=Colias crocea TaxID=72248 RepID=UPI001E280695|nr:lachesin-like isoform X2 [Colias croceus]